MTTAARSRAPMTPELREIQAPYRKGLDRVASEMRRIVLADAPLIARVGAHLMSMRGKMLRPTLVLLASEVEREPEPRAVSLAAVVELIHLATLVHDDAVDHSVLRRGMPTVNAMFSHQVSVIAGDFIYARALTELVGLGDLEPIDILTRVSAEMSVGELRQLGITHPLRFSEDDYDLLIGAKTASLMSAACEVGALAGAAAHRETLRAFGRSLGLVFQIVDDMMDYTGHADTTGKPAGLDLRERKVTLPLIAALREMPSSARKEVEMLFDTDSPTDAQLQRVTRLVHDHGGLEYARERAAEHARAASDAAAALPQGRASDSLSRVVRYVLGRHS
ncbi:MAG TPA: polyprenyl synthetase family protein [Gemmatimonadaceae bacterium]